MATTTSLPRRPASPPGESDACPEAIAGLIGGFPGLALVFDGAGRRRAGNRAAGDLDGDALARLADAATEVGAEGRGASITLATTDGRAYDVALTAYAGAGGPVLALCRDVTRERNLRQALVDSRQRYKDFAACATDFQWETAADGAFTFVSPGGTLGYDAALLVGRKPRTLLDPTRTQRTPPFERDIPVIEEDAWLLAADGRCACVQVSAVPILDADGRFAGARGVWRDVTKARARDAELATVRRDERIVAEIIARIREDGDLDDAEDRAAAALADGFAADRAFVHRPGATTTAGDSLSEATESAIAAALEACQATRPARHDVAGAAVLLVAIRGGDGVNGAIALARGGAATPWSDADAERLLRVADHVGLVIEQVRAHQVLRQQSLTDGLTGLLNRRAFELEVGRRVSLAERRTTPATLLFIDLDHFKAVNDTLGHAAGDAALIDVARLLNEHLRAGDVAARLGGDEFAVWCDGLTDTTAAARAKDLLAAAARLRSHSAATAPPLGLSIGVAQYRNGSGERLEGVIARADAALYLAKRSGRGCIAIAPPEPLPDGNGQVGTP